MPIDTYHVQGEAGHIGTPGAPILDFSLLVVVPSGLVSGHVDIRQALPPPHGHISLPVTGHIHSLGLPPAHNVVVLTGTYLVSFPPPAIGSILEHFNATFSVNSDWNGHGSFTYGGHSVSNVPVKKTP
jgi:hypothetical protein